MKVETNMSPIERDPMIGAALRWAEGEVPMDEVDWSAMRSSIRGRAEIPLARRRRAHARPSRWLRPLIPIAAAASVAVLIWTGGAGRDGPAAVVPSVVGTAYQISVQEALLADMTEQEFRRVVADRNDPDELLLIAVSQP